MASLSPGRTYASFGFVLYAALIEVAVSIDQAVYFYLCSHLEAKEKNDNAAVIRKGIGFVNCKLPLRYVGMKL